MISRAAGETELSVHTEQFTALRAFPFHFVARKKIGCTVF